MARQLTDPQQRFAKKVQIGLGLAVLLVVAPFSFLLLQATAAIIAIVILAAAAVFFAEPFAFWLAVNRIKAIKGIAAENQIETLEIDLQNRKEIVRQQKGLLTEIDAALINFKESAKKDLAKYPDMAMSVAQNLARRHAQRENRVAQIKDAEKTIIGLQDQLERAKAELRLAKASNELDRRSSQFTEGDKYDSMKVDAALDSIRTEVNKSMASVSFGDISVDPSKPLALNDDSMRYAFEALGIPQPVAVKALLQ